MVSRTALPRMRKRGKRVGSQIRWIGARFDDPKFSQEMEPQVDNLPVFSRHAIRFSTKQANSTQQSLMFLL